MFYARRYNVTLLNHEVSNVFYENAGTKYTEKNNKIT